MFEKQRPLIVLFIMALLSCAIPCAMPENAFAQSGLPGFSEILEAVTGSERKSESSGEQEKPAEGNEAGQTTEAEAQKDAKQEPSSAKGWVEEIWTFPILKTGDTWIRLNQLVLALGVLITGIILSSITGRLVGRLFTKFQGSKHNIGVIAQKTTFYALFLIVLVFVVQLANMPLAFLTLLITAVAIGASIGAKNTIYDYLSGFILAVERPVRVGDCIEIEDQRGFVTEIAGRFTIVRRFDGIDVLVPNSKLLENTVINWTLRDRKLRGEVKVSVLYDSPAPKVAELIRQAIEEHEETLDKPAAGVRLWEFGDNGLVFWAWFWTNGKTPLDIWRLQSDVHFRILELFRQNQITIPYPQRDVHLESSMPSTGQLPGKKNEQEKPPSGEAPTEKDSGELRKKGGTGTTQKRREQEEEQETEEELRDDEASD